MVPVMIWSQAQLRKPGQAGNRERDLAMSLEDYIMSVDKRLRAR